MGLFPDFKTFYILLPCIKWNVIILISAYKLKMLYSEQYIFTFRRKTIRDFEGKINIVLESTILSPSKLKKDMLRTETFYCDLTLWEKARVGCFERTACILSIVKQITSPGWMHETSAWAWCTGKIQRMDEGGEGGGRGDRDGEYM